MRESLKEFFIVLGSYLVAISRLLFLDVLFLLSGLQQILYTRCEIVNIEMKAVPLRCDITDATEKVAYIDKLCGENPDLVGIDDEDEDINFGDEGSDD